MADSKITALTALTAADPVNDMFPIVDVSDTSMAASGTTKRISANNILSSSPTASGALTVTGLVTAGSATITGDLTVDTSTLKVDSTNDRVGIGTASPAAGAKLGVFGATSVSTSDYIGSSTYAARFIGSSNGASSGISFLTNSASGQSTPASIHATPIADYRSALVATFSADASGAGYFAVNQFSPVGSSTFERFRVNRNGAVVLGGGTVDANGVGIAFPATQVASSDANTLDDYEEGTFTPTVIGTTTAGVGTYATQGGRYTKIGNLVTVQVYLGWGAHTGTGNMRFGNFPFTTSSETASNNGVAFGYVNNIALSASNVLTGFTSVGVTYIDAYQYPVGGGASTPVPIDTAGDVIFTASYRV